MMRPPAVSVNAVAQGAMFTLVPSRMPRQVGLLLFLAASCTFQLALVLHSFEEEFPAGAIRGQLG